MYSFSQKAPIKFGDVSMEELQMTTYDLDTSAPAIILCNYGKFISNESRFVHNIRIKILKNTGTSWGTFKYKYSDTKSNIRANTYNYINGEVVIDRLKNESIYKVRVFENYYLMNFAMPNVRAGSVIDIEISYAGIPTEWRFQESIPVKHSELILEPHIYMKYSKNHIGYEPLDEIDGYRWVTRDVPAFKQEPYIDSPSNYISRFEIEPMKYHTSGSDFAIRIHEWKSVNEILLKYNRFGIPMKYGSSLNDLVKEIEENSSNEEDKLYAAYQAVKQIKWNQETRLTLTQSNLAYPYKNKIGNSADINLTLTTLLHKLDINAYPVVLSTRDNGILSPFFPSIMKLNYVIACVKRGDEFILLDATEEFLPLGMLPERCINWRGRIVDYNLNDWIPLNTDKKESQRTYCNLTLDSNLILSGEISETLSEYLAFNFRKDYVEYTSKEEYLEDLELDYPDLMIDSCTIDNLKDIEKPVKAHYWVKFNNKFSKAGDYYYFTPLVTDNISENPFKLEERKYPVSFPYKKDINVVVSVELPEGFEITEMPESAKISLPNGDAVFLYSLARIGNKIQLSYQLKINKETFLVQEYKLLKDFYNYIVTKHAEPIILKKKDES